MASLANHSKTTAGSTCSSGAVEREGQVWHLTTWLPELTNLRGGTGGGTLRANPADATRLTRITMPFARTDAVANGP